MKRREERDKRFILRNLTHLDTFLSFKSYSKQNVGVKEKRKKNEEKLKNAGNMME